MATYSAFFSAGLLAPSIARCTTPVMASSAMPVSASPVDPVDRHLSVTPTPMGQTSPCSKASDSHSHAERPRMRRRRSSINIAASPMSHIKSPVRNAGAALQRTGIMSPTRSRAASVSMNEASENTSLFGRLRSGSVGGVVNQPRRTRRAIRRPVPLAPPPTAPLPAIPPPSPTTKCAGSLLPPALLISRQPLTARTSLTDNVGGLFSPKLASPTLLSPDYTPKISFNLSPGIPSSPAVHDRSRSCDNMIDEEMKEN